MSEVLEAIAESLIGHVKNENIATIDVILRSVQDKAMWHDVLRHQLNLLKLMDGPLDSDILLPRLAIFDITTMTAFHYAALRGADGILERFLEVGRLSVEVVMESGTTALQLASFAGAQDTVTMLIEKFRANVNVKDKYGWTPLHYATLGCQCDVIRLLISRGADVTSRDKDGTTAAFRAHAFGRQDIVSLFLSSTSSEGKDLLQVDDTWKNSLPIYGRVVPKVSRSVAKESTPGNHGESEYEVPVKGSKSDYEILRGNPDSQRETYSVASKGPQNSQKNAPSTNSEQPVYSTVDKERRTTKQSAAPLAGDTPNSRVGTVDGTSVNRGQNSDDVQVNCKAANVLAVDTKRSADCDPGYIGINTLTNVLRNEFLKFRSQQLNNQTTNPNQSLSNEDVRVTEIPSMSNVTSYGRTCKTSTAVCEDAAVYAGLLKASETCRIADQSQLQLENTSTGKVNIPSPGNPLTTDEPPPPIPPRIPIRTDALITSKSSSRGQVDPTLSENDKSMLMRILTNIERDSAAMEASFQALAARVTSEDDWKKLAYSLPLRTNMAMVEKKIVQIVRRYPGDVRRQTLELLRQWRSHRGQGATVGRLVVALRNCGLVEFVSDVEKAPRDFNV